MLLLINSHLTWSNHCRSVCSKAAGFEKKNILLFYTAAKSCVYFALGSSYAPAVLLSGMATSLSEGYIDSRISRSVLPTGCAIVNSTPRVIHTDIWISRFDWPSIMNRLTVSCLATIFI